MEKISFSYHLWRWRRLRQKVIFRGLIRVLIVGILFACCIGIGTRKVFLQEQYVLPAIILDAGHGGEDGGAVSCTGIRESIINLDITLRMDQLLGLLGEQAILLRSDDVSLHDVTAQTLREKKVSDLKNRADAVNSYANATLVSIHQNSYPEKKYRGTQVFYSPTEGSQLLAQALQMAIRTTLQPENSRQEKQIPDTVYLMNHIKNRAILIECGFLTNEDEEYLLRQPSYQRKLALVFAWALLE